MIYLLISRICKPRRYVLRDLLTGDPSLQDWIGRHADLRLASRAVQQYQSLSKEEKAGGEI